MLSYIIGAIALYLSVIPLFAYISSRYWGLTVEEVNEYPRFTFFILTFWPVTVLVALCIGVLDAVRNLISLGEKQRETYLNPEKPKAQLGGGPYRRKANEN
jgi:hypothetical protein